jgi:hypothetical protein
MQLHHTFLFNTLNGIMTCDCANGECCEQAVTAVTVCLSDLLYGRTLRLGDHVAEVSARTKRSPYARSYFGDRTYSGSRSASRGDRCSPPPDQPGGSHLCPATLYRECHTARYPPRARVGGTIAIGATQRNGDLLVTVQDDGAGFARNRAMGSREWVSQRPGDTRAAPWIAPTCRWGTGDSGGVAVTIRPSGAAR